MRTLDRKLLRELRSHLGMLLAVTSIIAVGVGCLVTLVSTYLNLTEAKQLYYAQCRMADFSIEVKKVPLAELFTLREMPEITEIRPRIQHYVTVALEGVNEPLNGQVLSLPDRREPIINDIVIRQGSYFTDRRDNEVIVNEAFARHHRLRPGQWIRLVLNNQQQELFVVGTAISSEFVYLLGSGTITPDPKRFGVFYLKQTYAEDVFDFRGSANQILGRLGAAAHGNSREVLRRAELKLADHGVFTTTPLEDQLSNRFLSQEIQGLRSFAVIAPSMFLAVAALVLNVLLSRLAQQQRTVVGTLKALGYSNLEVSWHFLKFGMAVGLVGALAGCALGHWLASGMTSIYAMFFQFPELHAHHRWEVYSLGTLVSVTCAVLGSLRGSRSVLRLNPAAAMRPSPPRRGGAIWLEHVRWFWRMLSSGWRMVLRNTLRSRLRTAASIFAAAMGAALLVNGFMLELAMTYMIDFQFRHILRHDRELLLADERGEEVRSEAARLPGVDRAEPVFSVACTFINGPHRKKGAISGLARGSTLTIPRDPNLRPIRIPDHGLAMTRELARTLHLKRGDLVGVEPIKGDRRLRYVPVVEIADSYLGLYVYADLDYLSRLVGEQRAVTGLRLATDQDRDHRDALLAELKEIPSLQSVTARVDMIRTLEETVLESQGIVIDLLVLFAGVVFFGSILNASLVSLAERQREIATLRVLGYGPWEIGSLLLRESTITTVLGTLLGMPLGYWLTAWLATEYGSDLFRLPVVTSTGLWIKTMIFALGFGLLTHCVVQRQIHSMDWLDALKTQE